MDKLWSALQEVKDPELPAVSVVELGMVHKIGIKQNRIIVEMLPTFMGCPALEFIRNKVSAQLSPYGETEVNFIHDPPWSSKLITNTGIEKLRDFGIAFPTSSLDKPACPFCYDDSTKIENLFGPTACRSIFYCQKCQQPFEAMKMI